MSENSSILERIDNEKSSFLEFHFITPKFLIISPPFYEELKQEIFGGIEEGIENPLETYDGMEICLSLDSLNNTLHVAV